MLRCLTILYKGKNLFYNLAVIAKTRHFVLPAQLALALEPTVKQARRCLDYLQLLEGDVLVTFCLIVGIYLLQRLVELCGKAVNICRLGVRNLSEDS